MAIVGGSNLLLSPDLFMAFSNQNFLSKMVAAAALTLQVTAIAAAKASLL